MHDYDNVPGSLLAEELNNDAGDSDDDSFDGSFDDSFETYSQSSVDPSELIYDEVAESEESIYDEVAESEEPIYDEVADYQSSEEVCMCHSFVVVVL